MKRPSRRIASLAALLLVPLFAFGCAGVLKAATDAVNPGAASVEQLQQTREKTEQVLTDLKATTQSVGDLVATLPIGTELQQKAADAFAKLGAGIDSLTRQQSELDGLIKQVKDDRAVQAAKAAATLLPSPWDKVATSLITALAVIGAYLGKRKLGAPPASPADAPTTTA
jgi:hypothetical protein